MFHIRAFMCVCVCVCMCVCMCVCVCIAVSFSNYKLIVVHLVTIRSSVVMHTYMCVCVNSFLSTKALRNTHRQLYMCMGYVHTVTRCVHVIVCVV